MALPTLDPGQGTAYRRSLSSVYTKRIRVALLDRKGDVVRVLSPSFRDGQVVVDADADVTRSVNLTLLDPRHDFGFDADTYSGGILDLTRMLRVWWQIDSPLLAKTLTIPVFTGPVSRIQREGVLLEVEGQGKEAYGMGKNWKTLTIKEGARKTDGIKAILRERMGETRLGGIPDLPGRFPSDMVMSRNDQPWKKAQKIAQSMNRQLYYDAAGRPMLRPKPSKPIWVFDNSEIQGELTGDLRTSADLTKVINAVRVTGPKPKGKKKAIVGAAVADIDHPLSPYKLGPEDAPMWLVKEIDNEHIRTQQEADELAEDALEQGLKLIHDVEFSCVPIPHLEPLDMVAVRTYKESIENRVRSFTLPLGLGGEMTVGQQSTYGIKARRKTGQGTRGNKFGATYHANPRSA